jgi:hypothetical protein
MSSSKFFPRGDILVHSGDFSNDGTTEEFQRFDSFLELASRMYPYRVIVFGQNDVKVFKKDWDRMRGLLPHATHVLCNSEATILGLKFYGYPWARDAKASSSMISSLFRTSGSGKSELIPQGLDVLVSGVAAFGKLDVTYSGEHQGMQDLAEAVKSARPMLHLHGAVHESRGFLNRKGGEGMVVNSCMTDYEITCLCNSAHAIICKLVHYDEFKVQKWLFSIGPLEIDDENC